MKSSQGRCLPDNDPRQWLPLSNSPLARLKQLGLGKTLVDARCTACQPIHRRANDTKFSWLLLCPHGNFQVAWTSHPYDALFTWKFSQDSKATEKDRRRWNRRCLSIRSYGKPTQTNRQALLRHEAT